MIYTARYSLSNHKNGKSSWYHDYNNIILVN